MIGEQLTLREAELVNHLSHGRTLKQAAHEMRISPKTADVYALNAKRKLDATTSNHLIRLAMEAGYLSPDPAADLARMARVVRRVYPTADPAVIETIAREALNAGR